MAVRFVSLFFECAFIQLLQTEAAHKMLWMEFSEHGSDAPARDWFPTHCTERTSRGVVASLAVRETFMLEEVSVSEGFLTFFAYKAVRVPLFV